MHQAAFAMIVVDGKVPGRAIVPEGDRALAPLEAGVELRLCGVGIEIIEQGPAFVFGPAFEMCREGRVHIERLAAGLGMAKDDGMYGVLRRKRLIADAAR